ncbi:MAG: DNA recombination protein RmuC [Dehalococcoidia bacterium]|nr:DNA recombination protein RmuC [Dehalococcoidia bacterium]
MEIIVSAGIVLVVGLLVVVLIVLLRNNSQGGEARTEALLMQRFMEFQSTIHTEMGEAKKQMEDSRSTIDRHALKTLENINTMGTTINKLIQQQEEAQKLGQSLKDIIQVPKLRGSYGEIILEEMLEQALPRGIWEKQYCIDGSERVDAVIKFKDVVVPIDAKFPRESYQKYLAADSAEEKAKYWKEHENAVKVQIKSISEKYVKTEKGTTDFALMFIPSEAIYYETIADKNFLGQVSGLSKFAQDNKVIPVSPNTFYAFMQVVLMGVRNMEMVKNAQMLRENLTRLEKSFGLFYTKYEDLGKNVVRAAEAYRIGENHIIKYKNQLDNVLEFEALKGETVPTPEELPPA